jgi:hypothetical protein
MSYVVVTCRFNLNTIIVIYVDPKPVLLRSWYQHPPPETTKSIGVSEYRYRMGML